MSTRVGTHLDRYEIVAEIGRGAMGVVYLARDPKLDRTVAIKTVSLYGLDLDAEVDYRERFVIEARAAGRLSHAGIVTIFDVREEPETRAPYLVMEYIEGQSLHKLLSRENRTLPLSTTLYLVQEIAEALHYAHSQGVVHRDIKPANIIVDAQGHAKIADFGIAKLNQTNLTLPGQVLGSPAFMAPEQLREEDIDGRSDLFSLGVILYTMLTGHRPFQGNSTTTVCFNLVNHEPLPVSAFESKFPPELDAIVSRALAKDPERRYQSGMEMAADIQRLREANGFVNRQIEWPASSQKTNTHTYIPTAAKPGTAEATVPAQVAATIPAVAGSTNRGVRSGALWFPSTNALAAAILAAAMGVGFFFFWQTPRHQLNKPVQMEPEAQPISVLRDDATVSEQPTITKVSKPPAGISRPRPKLPVAQTDVPRAIATPRATLQIEIDHHFIDAHASVWVDNNLVYAHALRGDRKRRGLIFQKVEGHQFEAITVPAGKHDLRVRIQSPTDSYDESKTMADAMIGSNESMLRIVCRKKPEELQVSLQ